MRDSDRLEASQTQDGRYRLLIDAVTDYAIYMLDPTGTVTSWNPGAQRFKGYSASEIIGEHFSRFYTQEDRETELPRRALETATREGKFESEGWRVRKDGTRFWAFVVIDPIWSPSGELVGFAKVTRDLTERRANEEALRQTQEQFKLLVQGVSDYAIYLLSPQGIVTNWNLGAQKIKGYQSEEIIGEHFSRFYTPEDRKAGEPKRSLDTAVNEGRFENEGWRLRKDGSRFWAHVIVDAIRDDDGELLGFAKITRDITERRETQQALERARETLMQSQKMDAIGQLTGGIAHDFNNLLMAILSSLELMRKRLPADPKLLALLDNAAQGAQRGAVLTQRMLAFARRQELKHEPIDVQHLVRSMEALLQRSLGPLVQIETRFPHPTQSVLSDYNQLEMALLNLAVNARDSMSDGGRIVISAREEIIQEGSARDLEPGVYVCLSVSDNGSGMDKETLRRAVEPFFTTKGPGKGTGLGLAMVHGITKQSGGAFILNSEVGKGTQAELWLPVASSDAIGAMTGANRIPAVERSRTDRVLTVLAVDDDWLVLTNTVAMLEDLGHKCLPTSSPFEALTMLDRAAEIDLVLSDQVMPGMSGLQLAKAVREKRPNLPVILATGYAEIEPGATVDLPRLTKPFTQADLMRSLEQVLQELEP